MNILILGGGVFLGAALVDEALRCGHALTVFNRGRARGTWPAGVTVRTGDRHHDLGSLPMSRWDAVIDTCGYTPAELRLSCAALRDCGTYLFISSISAYASTAHAPLQESDPLAGADGIATDDRDRAHYGAKKAACEAEVQRAFGERALIVRPGLIVGPGDRSGRFSHWPWRTAEGGEMLVPDAPPAEPLQFIDVRDLAAWLVRLLAQGARGVFNATGPAGGGACTWPRLLQACHDEVLAAGGSPARAMPVAETFLRTHDVAPWSELPLWLPSTDPENAGFFRVDLSRALGAGLATRPLRETVAGVLAEGTPPADDPRRAGKLARHREAELLARWRKA